MWKINSWIKSFVLICANHPSSHPSTKFHGNPYCSLFVILLSAKPTNKHMDRGHDSTSLAALRSCLPFLRCSRPEWPQTVPGPPRGSAPASLQVKKQSRATTAPSRMPHRTVVRTTWNPTSIIVSPSVPLLRGVHNPQPVSRLVRFSPQWL